MLCCKQFIEVLHNNKEICRSLTNYMYLIELHRILMALQGHLAKCEMYWCLKLCNNLLACEDDTGKLRFLSTWRPSSRLASLPIFQ